MPLFNSQAIGTPVLVAFLTVVAIAFAIERYVEWSSEAAMAEFMIATSASDHSNESSTAFQFHNRRTGCPGSESCQLNYQQPRGNLQTKQIGAGRRELHVGSGVMQFQPTPCDGELQAGEVFRGSALVAEQEGAVEFFDIDPAILNWFEGVCVL